jgi:hypothetical protein
MNRHLWCLLAPLLVGCVEPALATVPSNNPHIEVDTLLTHDGCTVYRFRDGQYHYFVRCPDPPRASTLSRVSCGKNCTRPEEIPTVVASPGP